MDIKAPWQQVGVTIPGGQSASSLTTIWYGRPVRILVPPGTQGGWLRVLLAPEGGSGLNPLIDVNGDVRGLLAVTGPGRARVGSRPSRSSRRYGKVAPSSFTTQLGRGPARGPSSGQVFTPPRRALPTARRTVPVPPAGATTV
jgi:hypothetical protein